MAEQIQHGSRHRRAARQRAVLTAHVVVGRAGQLRGLQGHGAVAGIADLVVELIAGQGEPGHGALLGAGNGDAASVGARHRGHEGAPLLEQLRTGARTGCRPAAEVEQIAVRQAGVARHHLVDAGKGIEHIAGQGFRIMHPVERGEAPHDRIGAAQGLHRAIGTAVRCAERDEAAHARQVRLAQRAARDQPAHAVSDDQERVGRIGAQAGEERGTEIGQVQPPVVVMHVHRKPGSAQSQLQGQVTEGQGAERDEATRLWEPQPIQTAFHHVLRVEPDQVGRIGTRRQRAELRAHDAGQEVYGLRLRARRRALRGPRQAREQCVVGGAEHGAELAARGARGQQQAQFLIAVPQPVVDRESAAGS